MKKFISLQALMIISLGISSTSIIEAYNNTMKYEHTESKKNAKNHKSSMKCIEKDLSKIRHDFEKSGDMKHANKQLDKIPERIDLAVSEMKQNEQHGKLWETHKHTLNRKLREVREFVNKK